MTSTSDAGADATPDPVFVSEPDYQLPVAVAPSCPGSPPADPKSPKLPRHHRVYDFTPIAVVPIRRGPTIAERPYVDYDRRFERARAMFSRNNDAMTGCWQWASARGAKETTLAVEITFDPRVAPPSITVTSATPGDETLIACVKEMFVPEYGAGSRDRVTLGSSGGGYYRAHSLSRKRVSADLVFNNDQPTWPKLPSRPKAPKKTPTIAPTPACPVDSTSVDEIHLPVLIVTNWDYRRFTSQDALVPGHRIACYRPRHHIDKGTIRVALRSQIGALNACYADAVQRTPGLSGDLGAKLVIHRMGTFGQVQVAGVGDASLHACFATALDALWVYSTTEDEYLDVNLTFTLAPAPVPSADPTELLKAGDVDAALAVWVEQLTSPHLPLNGCIAHGEILVAMRTLAPWLDDARVIAALANLTRSVLALEPADAKACVANVDGFLTEYLRMRRNEPPATDWPMRHLERYEAVLPLAHLLEWGPYLRWHHANWLLRTSRADEGEDLLSGLANDPVVGPAVTEWLALRAARPEMLHDTCWN